MVKLLGDDRKKVLAGRQSAEQPVSAALFDLLKRLPFHNCPTLIKLIYALSFFKPYNSAADLSEKLILPYKKKGKILFCDRKRGAGEEPAPRGIFTLLA